MARSGTLQCIQGGQKVIRLLAGEGTSGGVEAQRRNLVVEYTLNAVGVESEPPMQRNNDCVCSAWQRPCVHAESGRSAGE